MPEPIIDLDENIVFDDFFINAEPIIPQIPEPDIYEIPTGKPSLSFSEKIYFKRNSNNFYSIELTEEHLAKLVRTLLYDPKLNLFIVGNVGGDFNITGNSKEALAQKTMLNGKWVNASELMNARALAVYKFLISKGINPSRLSYGPGNAYNKGSGMMASFVLRKD